MGKLNLKNSIINNEAEFIIAKIFIDEKVRDENNHSSILSKLMKIKITWCI